MPTMLKLGPKDHGRELSEEEFEGADCRGGHKYEIIDGRLYVSPLPNFPHDLVENWLYGKVRDYAKATNSFAYVTNKPRAFVRTAEKPTIPEPDIAAFKVLPPGDGNTMHWRDFEPTLVVEILGDDSFEKDMVRNVDLYLRIPSIQEYWVFDIREDVYRPKLIVHCRRGEAWKTQTVAPGGTYTTKLLPGFRLVVDPRT